MTRSLKPRGASGVNALLLTDLANADVVPRQMLSSEETTS
jgi:hypothetical protein